MNAPEKGRIVLAAWVAVALYGCAVGRDYHAPVASTDPNYTSTPQPDTTSEAAGPGGAAQRFVAADAIGGAWWQTFNSDALNRLVQRALADSPTLLQARMKLTQAQQDYLAQAGGTEWPQVDASLSAAREKVDPAAFGIGNVPQPGPFTLYSASINVSYVLDLFGANRRALEALAQQVDYQQYEFDAARLSLAGNVVTTALHRASLARQITLSEAILATQTQQLQITEQRYALGGVSRVDLLSQQTQTQQAQAGLPPLRKQVAQTEHQLAVYLGAPPAALEGNDAEVLDLDKLSLPENLPLTLPSTLARQRPDIRAAEALLHQASANVGVATANLYPQITLSGSAGSERVKVSDLLTGFNVWNFGAGIAQPLFHGGELHARKRSAEAAYEAALAGYRQTVLQGLQEVADALWALRHDADELQFRAASASTATESAEIARGRYAVGGISQLALLEAQRQELQATLDRVDAQAQRYVDTAALYQALGARP